MDYSKISASGDVNVIVMPKHEWDKKMSAIKEDGNRVANQMREQDKPFIVKQGDERRGYSSTERSCHQARLENHNETGNGRIYDYQSLSIRDFRRNQSKARACMNTGGVFSTLR